MQVLVPVLSGSKQKTRLISRVLTFYLVAYYQLKA